MSIEKGLPLIGKDLNPEDLTQFNEEIHKKRQESRKFVEGEIVKSKEDIKAIELANRWIGMLVKESGIKDYKPIDADQIHLYNFEGDQAVSDEYGFADTIEDQIYINVSDDQNLKDLSGNEDLEEKKRVIQMYKRIHVITHEMLHLAGFQSYSAEKEKNNLSWNVRRAGYGSAVNKLKSNQPLHFFSLNEATVETISKDLLSQNKEGFEDPYLSVNDYLGDVFLGDTSYKDDRSILANLIQDIARYEKEDKVDIWKQFIKGYFSGNLMQLRTIDKVYGKGTLRLYAGIEANNRHQLSLFKAYLNAPSRYIKQGLKDNLAKLINQTAEES